VAETSHQVPKLSDWCLLLPSDCYSESISWLSECGCYC